MSLQSILMIVFLAQCKAVDPNVKYIVGDIYSHDESFDIIIASHVLEHVPNPIKFLQRLQELSREWVIVACPWRESPLRTAGHINTIDKTILNAVKARNIHIYTDLSWGHDKECVIFCLQGMAHG
jgi:2-polyprenyl-3-methyl-5-hydroxy-6-metoxy-1,4-benzoquinol methylase